MKKAWILGVAVLCAGVVAAITLHRQRDSRLSYVVALVTKPAPMAAFLEKPGVSFVQGYVRFKPDLPDDVFFGLDEEFVEGVDHPLYVKGGDWMAFVGIQRTGTVWVGLGTEKTMAGEPSTNRGWKIVNLGADLKPDTWYRIRTEADFGKRQYRSFEIEGGGLHKKLDLAGLKLDYPNMIPFDKRCMTYYCGAFRGRSLMKPGGLAVVFYDDMTGGVLDSDGKETVCFANDFDLDQTVRKQPIKLPTIQVGDYREGSWYFERDESLFKVVKEPFARSGQWVGEADARLDDPK